MSDTSAGVTVDEIAAPGTRPPLPLPGWFAALQVFAVCGIPTGVVIMVGLLVTGALKIPTDLNHPPLEFFATISLLDTAAVALLIRLFLWLSGETSRDVFIGFRPAGREIVRGLAWLPAVYVVAIGIKLGLQKLVPALHNVPENPYAQYMTTPVEAAVFILVVLLAGGVREELSRAFSLHRFGQRLGGARLGLVIYSLVFGAFHYTQGLDTAVVVGVLGAFWGLLYLKRRSVIAPMVNHAAFDAIQVVAALLLSRSIRA